MEFLTSIPEIQFFVVVVVDQIKQKEQKMCDKKEDLPKNWFKKFSRSKYRGREYYYNKKTSEKSWDHPKRSIANRNVVNWLNRSTTVESPMLFSYVFLLSLKCLVFFWTISDEETQVYCYGHNFAVPVNEPDLTKLEIEYEKFENFLAEIERGEAFDSSRFESEHVRSSSFDPLIEYNKRLVYTSDMKQFRSMDVNYNPKSISIDDQKAVQEVSLICNDDRNLCNNPIVLLKFRFCLTNNGIFHFIINRSFSKTFRKSRYHVVFQIILGFPFLLNIFRCLWFVMTKS